MVTKKSFVKLKAQKYAMNLHYESSANSIGAELTKVIINKFFSMTMKNSLSTRFF